MQSSCGAGLPALWPGKNVAFRPVGYIHTCMLAVGRGTISQVISQEMESLKATPTDYITFPGLHAAHITIGTF